MHIPRLQLDVAVKPATSLPKPVHKGQKYNCNVIGLVTKYEDRKSVKQLNKDK